MGEKSEAKPTKETSWLVFITGYLIKGGMLMKHSYLKYRKHPALRILLRDFNQPGIWKSTTASCKQLRKFLECTEDNFLIQVTDSMTTGQHYLTHCLPTQVN